MASAPPPEAINNIAAFSVTLDGRDLTDRIAPRLLSLSLSEKRGGEADTLELVVHDHDGAMAIPKTGARISVAIGWAQGRDVRVGVVNKGSFKVDEAEWSGPPDIITIRARSADFTSDYRIRKEKSWKDTTVGAIVTEIAGRNDLQPMIAPELASIAVPVLAQDGRSDMALVRALGRKHDAIATVKNGKLIFSPTGKATTSTGKPIPTATIRRSLGDGYSWRLAERDKYDGAEARYHDQDAAERKTVGAGGEGKRKRLKKVYANEADAKAAAEAENKRIARKGAELSLKLALGQADLYPDRGVAVAGFKPEIDGTKWLISEVTHRLDGQGGFTSELRLETAG
ncbi:hypothetical protein FHS96_003072 [Sphingomonas zeicaulis]|uniref:contractile injection system protein, VgrG/Pvc8 family n=1 Tax=Sphingomonas zeicaulis TaxID=1632740 RepID=UPI003D2599D2